MKPDEKELPLKEEVYAVGDKMPGGIIIEEVHPDHVVLNRGGRLESLQLGKDEDVGQIAPQRATGAHLPAGSPGEQLCVWIE